MDADRSEFPSADPGGREAGGEARAPAWDGEPAVTATSLLAALVVAALTAGLSAGFFFWLPGWVHALVFAAAFLLMLVFGRRLAMAGG